MAPALNLPRFLFGLRYGRRLPTVDGTLSLDGVRGRVLVHRDGWGVPYIEAEDDADAWFGLGFCHGQDRGFQLELLLRAVRGTLAELAGPQVLAVDRLARRIGYVPAAERQLAVLDADLRQVVEAYAAGVTAGAAHGLRRPAHEFALLRSRPTPWTAADVLGLLKLQSFLLAANWDAELARWKILTLDGPEALAALDPSYPEWLPVTAPPGAAAGAALDRLADDLAVLAATVPLGGGSNGWALAASRTATGRPLLANDPHLPPTLPPHWYLAHVRTPRWAVAGASFVGGPGFPAGHNGFAAWGLTAGLIDNTDLFLEEIGPDGLSVRHGDGFVPCAVRTERIQVRGGAVVEEEVLVTLRGPIIGPALEDSPAAVSLRATWLDAVPLDGFLSLHKVRSFGEFRAALSRWPALSASMVYADTAGTVGWQLAGRAPRRRKGWGMLPMPGWDPGAAWENEPVPFAQMPHLVDPPPGYVAAANSRPVPEGTGPFLGADWIDGYRLARIVQALEGRRDWHVAGCQALQMDLQSVPWSEIRAAVLAASAATADARLGLELLASWDGRVSADAPAATLYEFFLAEMIDRTVKAKAPRSWEWAAGKGFTPLLPHTLFAVRRVGHLVGLIRTQPDVWFARPWPDEIADALTTVVRRLRKMFGADVSRWAWGRVRPLRLLHPLGRRKFLDRVFNLGPFPWGGDAKTPSQAAVYPDAPAANPAMIASVRLVIDVGNWSACRFALPGGQSGNPLSPHYADQLPLWRRGEGIPIAWTDDEIRRAARHTLELWPA